MNPWYAKAAILVASVVMIIIRAPHGQRSRGVPVARSLRGTLEVIDLSIAWLAFFLPILWIATSILAFADAPLRSPQFVAGCAVLALALWLFHRSHADLGTNWSITLEVREEHRLITSGVYASIRHPMYTSLILYGLGQALVLSNLVAGPLTSSR